MQSNRFMEALNKLLQWVIRLAGANLLWLLFNIPIVFIAVTLFMSSTVNELLFCAIMLIVLVPVFFFPATLALFALIRKWTMQQDVDRVVRFYWQQYKENYVTGLLGGIVLTLIWTIFVVDYYYSFHFAPVFFKYMFLALFVYLIVFTTLFLSNTVHFQIKLMDALKNAVLMTLKNPLLSISIAFFNILLVLLSFNAVPILIPFFTGSLVAMVSFKGFNKVCMKLPKYEESLQDSKA